jgi:hypothetical protein
MGPTRTISRNERMIVSSCRYGCVNNDVTLNREISQPLLVLRKKVCWRLAMVGSACTVVHREDADVMDLAVTIRPSDGLSGTKSQQCRSRR